MPMKELTYGQKAVGITFNPGNNSQVNEIKHASAFIIDLLAKESLKDGVSPEKLSLLECAIRELQTSQMWAVKAITYQY